MNQDGKTTWPELEGTNADEAIEIIKQENPSLTVQKCPADGFFTFDYREDRVRVFYDRNTNLVVRTPTTG